MKILVTGAAGFIGSGLVQVLARRGDVIVGIDNINSYYDVELKYERLAKLTGIQRDKIEDGVFVQSELFSNYRFMKLDLENNPDIQKLFREECFDYVCNLAAQPGVRYSLENPYAYVNSNIVGFLNILEGCRNNNIKHLVYASSSSVYAMNKKVPFAEKDRTDHPISLYAATKKSNELMAHTYSHLYGLPTTGLRFFTVYGPWGRPDMAPFLFTDAIMKEKPIKVFNNGDMLRDFTYVDDIVEGVAKAIYKVAQPSNDWNPLIPETDSSSAPYRLYNIGNSSPEKLMDFIQAIESSTGKAAEKIFLPMQPGDVYQTNADVSSFESTFDFKPQTDMADGVQRFVDWYKVFYKL